VSLPLTPKNDPERLPLRIPDCPSCGLPMRLVAVVPHARFHHLDTRLFECRCGERVSDVAARLN